MSYLAFSTSWWLCMDSISAGFSLDMCSAIGLILGWDFSDIKCLSMPSLGLTASMAIICSLMSPTSFSFSNVSSSGWIGSMGFGGGMVTLFFSFLLRFAAVWQFLCFRLLCALGNDFSILLNFLTFKLVFRIPDSTLGCAATFSRLLAYVLIVFLLFTRSNLFLFVLRLGTKCLVVWPEEDIAWSCVAWLSVTLLLSHAGSSWKSRGIRATPGISSILGILSLLFISLVIGCIEGGLPTSSISLSIDPIGVGHAAEMVSIAGILVGREKLFGGSSEYVAKFWSLFMAFWTTVMLLVTALSLTAEEEFVPLVLFTGSGGFTLLFVKFADTSPRAETRGVGVVDVGMACTVSRMPLRRGPCWFTLAPEATISEKYH